MQIERSKVMRGATGVSGTDDGFDAAQGQMDMALLAVDIYLFCRRHVLIGQEYSSAMCERICWKVSPIRVK
jgi:hypothetical protein